MLLQMIPGAGILLLFYIVDEYGAANVLEIVSRKTTYESSIAQPLFLSNDKLQYQRVTFRQKSKAVVPSLPRRTPVSGSQAVPGLKSTRSGHSSLCVPATIFIACSHRTGTSRGDYVHFTPGKHPHTGSV